MPKHPLFYYSSISSIALNGSSKHGGDGYMFHVVFFFCLPTKNFLVNLYEITISAIKYAVMGMVNVIR